MQSTIREVNLEEGERKSKEEAKFDENPWEKKSKFKKKNWKN